MKKILSLVAISLVLILILTGCGKENVENTTTTSKNNTAQITNTQKNNNTNNTTKKEETKVNYAENAEKQMAMPEKDEEIAIFHVKNYGEIKVKFFKDVAPKAVENFVTHSKEGYYNGVTFHRIMNEFMIQGGDPLGNGTGGESIWGEDFEEELSDTLVPFRGSLCMASKGLRNSPSLGSQFFITQANYNELRVNYMKSYGFSDELIEQYKKYGGDVISLYKQYTVFGQVFEGMDVVDKIAKETKVEDDNGTVLKENQPVITSIEITKF